MRKAAQNPIQRRRIQYEVVRCTGALNCQRSLHGVGANLTGERQEKVVKAWHQMISDGRGHEDSNSTEIASSVGGNEGVADTPRHRRKSHECPAVFASCEERVALQDRSLHVESWKQFTNGSDLVEPVSAGLLSRFWHLNTSNTSCNNASYYAENNTTATIFYVYHS